MVEETDVLRMMAALEHRGPDESGLYIDDWVGLGSVRLSIIDLMGGSQPIHNEDESLWIVYNGEVFNYPELRADLEARGHRFYTETDTEVILQLYEEKGNSCLDDLNGQFAFGIWDRSKHNLFLARDRVGIHPLYYTVCGNLFLFASEVKAIFMMRQVERRIDPTVMDQLFTFWTPLPGETVFKGIRELPPGHFLNLSEWNINIRRYWDFQFCPPEEQPDLPMGEISESLQTLLKDSVRIRLRADVPVASYLSGGLDSSGITALVKDNFDNHLRTFGIHFAEKAFDEREYQDSVALHLQTEHDPILVTNDEIGRSFSDALWHCEQPLLRTAPIPLFLLSRKVRESGLKVVLSGEGADEIFGGYNIFKEAKIRRFWAKQPSSELRPLLIGKLYPYIFENRSRAKYFLRSFFGDSLGAAEDPFYSHIIRWRSTERLKTFFSEGLREAIGDYCCYDDLRQRLPSAFRGWEGLAKAQYLEMILFLSNYLLSSQGDRMAMAHGVEVRPPYLDHRIIEFMGMVAAKWKILGLDEKFILKETYRVILPQKILKRPKHPYRAPISQSLLKGNSSVEPLVSDQCLNDSGLFAVPKVKMFLRKVQKGGQVSELDNMALAGIVSCQAIHKYFVGDFPSRSVCPVYPTLVVDKRMSARRPDPSTNFVVSLRQV